MSTKTNFENGTLIVTRIYNASREAVFDAWVNTAKVEQWWGCADTTNVKSEIEPLVGGKFVHEMTLKGKHIIPGNAVFTEFYPPARLAYASGDANDPMSVSVEFIEVDSGTLVRLVHTGIPDMRVEGDVELSEIIRGGWTAAFGKLCVFMEKQE